MDALEKAGCEKVFTETASGAKRDRPQLIAVLEFMREGDTFVVWKLGLTPRSRFNRQREAGPRPGQADRESARAA